MKVFGGFPDVAGVLAVDVAEVRAVDVAEV